MHFHFYKASTSPFLKGTSSIGLFLYLTSSFIYDIICERIAEIYNKIWLSKNRHRCKFFIWYCDSYYVPPGITGGTLCFWVVRLSVRPSVRPSHFTGTILCAALSKSYDFQQIIMHVWQCPHDVFWPTCNPPFNLFPRSCLTWIFLIDLHWWVPLRMQRPAKAMTFWQLSCMYCSAHNGVNLFCFDLAPVKWSWTVHEWFLNSSCAVHEHLFMNSSWTWNGQVHEVGEVHKFEFMNLWVHELVSSWTCEFMNLWVHELVSSWIVH